MKTRPIPIEGLSGKYSITEDGKVYSHLKKRYLKGAISIDGYLYYYLVSKWYSAHRLVYRTFVGPITYTINHIDMDKLNNHVTNLEDITRRENSRKAWALKPWDTSQNGRKPGWGHSEETKRRIGESNGQVILVIDGKGGKLRFITIGKAAEYLGVSYSTVIRALRKGLYQDFPIGSHRVVRES